MVEPSAGRLVALTRPRPESEALAAELEARGHRCLIAPLLEIHPIPAAAAAAPLDVQAILVTSRNAVPALAGRGTALPVFAVGEATAAAVREVHGGLVRAAAGDGAALAGLVGAVLDPAAGALLHLAGEDVRPEPRAALEAAGFEVRREVVYRAVPVTALAADLVAALREGALAAILFFSPRTASTFRRLALEAGLESRLATTDALCLSANVGRELEGVGFRRRLIAAAPERARLLGLLDGVR